MKHEIQLVTRRGLQVVELEVPVSKTRRTKKVRRMVWDLTDGVRGGVRSHMTKERVVKLLREAYDAGHHAGASNPYC